MGIVCVVKDFDASLLGLASQFKYCFLGKFISLILILMTKLREFLEFNDIFFLALQFVFLIFFGFSICDFVVDFTILSFFELRI